MGEASVGAGPIRGLHVKVGLEVGRWWVWIVVRKRKRRSVGEVGAGFESAHGASGNVVRTCSLFSSVEGAEPASLFGLRVSDLCCVAAPGTTTHATVSHVARRRRRRGRRPPCPCALLLGVGACVQMPHKLLHLSLSFHFSSLVMKM